MTRLAMSVRAVVVLGAISLALSMAFVAQTSGYLPASVSEDMVEFQDGAGNSIQPFSETGSCVATWTQISLKVAAETRWNLATGAPDPGSYKLNEGCLYDRTTPSNTPVSYNPVPKATVDGVSALVTCCPETPDEVALFTDANAGSTVVINFYFDILNPQPTPTPIPSAGPVALVALAALFAAVIAWRLKRRSQPSRVG
jgi:hypothetical protein